MNWVFFPHLNIKSAAAVIMKLASGSKNRHFGVPLQSVGYWKTRFISEILCRGKRTTPNHKVKQTYVKPEDDWIRIEKNHEPLVSDLDFENRAKNFLGMDTRTSPYQKQGISVVRNCCMCGLWCTYDKKGFYCGRARCSYYLPSVNKETKRCSSHRIPKKDLEDAVMVMLNSISRISCT